MREQCKKIMVGLTSFLILMTLTGCTRATPEKLLSRMAEKTAGITSAEMKMTLELLANGDVKGTTADMSVSMDANVKMTTDPETAYIEGSMDMAFLGQKESVDMEIYTEANEENYITYSRSNSDDWYKTKTEHMSLEYDWSVFKDMYENFELKEELEEVDDKECYVLFGELSGDELNGIMESTLGVMGDSADVLGNIDWEDTSIPIEIYIIKKNQYPARITLDVQKLAQAAFDKQELNMDCDIYNIEMTYMSFESIDTLEVPAEVKENAIATSSILEIDTKGDGVPEAADQAAELGENWNSMTISMGGKVITLPCTYEQLIAAGLELEDGELTEDDVINAEDSKDLNFIKPGRTYAGVTAGVYNPLDQPIQLSDALVCEIAIMEYEESDMEIIFPGNIKIGMSRDEAVAVYGEPDYAAQASYGWYQDFDEYEICVLLTFDEETMQIDFMDMYYLTW